MRGITKRYGATVANDQVDLDVYPSEIHALLGENGAGKSTLVSILFGLVALDSGEIWIGDEQVHFSSPHDALERGIGMVHQHFMLIQRFTVATNVVLGSVSPWNMAFRPREVEREVEEASLRFGLGIDPRARVSDLPIDTQQRVEILKLLYRGAKALILDEPTSSLGPTQMAALFGNLRDLRAAGHSIVIVTHKLSEVMEIADRVTVLKNGRNVTTVARGSFDEHSLAQAMTGRNLQELPRRRLQDTVVQPVLQVQDLRVSAGRRLHAVNGLSFELHGGEILGIAGVEGNGQRELVEALAGVAGIDGGTVRIENREITGASTLELREAGISVIHEDRQGWDLILDMTISENLALVDVPAGKASRHGILKRRAIKTQARKLLQEYDVRPPDPDLRVLSLSGGNQQKVVLARELSRNPRVLIAANPTRGLDIGAADYVHRRLLDVREQGNAILLVSHDLDELLKLSDRVVVLYRGRNVYEARIEDASMEQMALAMAGTVAATSDGEGRQPVES